MGNRTRAKFADMVRVMLRNLDVSEGASHDILSPGYCMGPSGFVKLVGAGLEASRDFWDEMSKREEIRGRIDDKTGGKALAQMLIGLKGKSDIQAGEIEVAIDEMVNQLKRCVTDCIVFLPVENLLIGEVSELPVGRVVFHPYDPGVQSWQSQLEAILARMQGDAPVLNTCNPIAQHFDRVLWQPCTIAEIRIQADETMAFEVAKSEVEASLDLLRCYTHLLFSRGDNPFIGLCDSLAGDRRSGITFNQQSRKWVMSLQKEGKLCCYTITQERLQHVRDNCAFDILSGILAKPEAKRSKMEGVLTTAMRWIGQGVIARGIPEQALHFAVAWETLMMGKKEEANITEKVSLRLAFLLDDSLGGRKLIYERAKKLYKLRSKVAHAGEQDIRVKDRVALEEYAVLALIRLAKRLDEWQEHKQFVDWVGDRILS